MDAQDKIALIYNPQAGSGKGADFAAQLRAFLQQHAPQAQIDCLETKQGPDAYRFAKDCAGAGYRLVVAIGGDGTVNQVAGGLLDGGGSPVLGVLPLGTVNNFAQAMNIPLDGKSAMQTLTSGHVKAVDIGELNGTHMVSSMTLGLMADIAKNVPAKRKKMWGPLAFLKDFFAVVRRNRRYFLEIIHDHGVLVQKVSILLITMTDTIAGKKIVSPNTTADDGFFHIYCIPRISLGQILRNLPGLLSGSLEDLPGIDYIASASLSIRCKNGRQGVSVRIDGDPALELPVKMKVIPRGLTVLIPPKDEASPLSDQDEIPHNIGK